MKNKITMFLLGGLTFLTIGAGVATSTDVLTVKPSTPKSIIHQSFRNYGELSEIISEKSKEGYIVKQYTVVKDSGYIVMEKY